MMSPTRFRFLNDEHDVLTAQDWNASRLPRLWLYHLHYFDDLNAEDASDRIHWHRNLMDRWIAENPPARGVGWEPYPLSLRIVNWIKWALAGNGIDDALRHSLAVQVRILSRTVEWHLLGNHLFANAKALVFAGCFFDGNEANDWLRCGMEILAREIPEQILADGGHFERSTMYHALVLEDMLDLVNVTTAFADAVSPPWRAVVADWLGRIGPMRAWLAAMCHPDGEIGLFNDAAIGIAPGPSEIERYAADLGLGPTEPISLGVRHLKQSGYLRVAQDEMVALIDVAPVGPDYLPGHAHADTLTFELSVFGQRVFVNSGTSCYGLGAERTRQRGTAAHNTVVVDGRDSSEVWAGFRVARRARPQGLQVLCENGVKVVCSHNGYRRLPGRPVHTRQWLFDGTSLVVEDRVSGRFGRAEARFHLHPRITPEARADHLTGRLFLDNSRRLTWQVERGGLMIERSTYHPCFGCTESTWCLVLCLHNGGSRIRLDWE